MMNGNRLEEPKKNLKKSKIEDLKVFGFDETTIYVDNENCCFLSQLI
jgi:hypothetical protein